jgi:hypothetical protein
MEKGGLTTPTHGIIECASLESLSLMYLGYLSGRL